MDRWNTSASDAAIEKTIISLKQNGITAFVVPSLAEAKAKVLNIIPQGSEVHTNTSVTLDESGISQEINESGKYNATKPKLMQMSRQTEGLEMQKLGAGPEWALGSVHAVTEDGKVIIASNSGSNLPSYAYGSPHIIWVVGSQKIVKDLDQGMKRIYEHTLPLESDRAKKAYGVEGSFVSKLLIFNKEPNPSRIQMIIIKTPVGY